MMTQATSKHYSVQEMRDLFSVSRSTLDRLARSGQLKKLKFGRRTLYNAADVERYLANQSK